MFKKNNNNLNKQLNNKNNNNKLKKMKENLKNKSFIQNQ